MMAVPFTQEGRKAVFWAQEEAMRLGHATVGPEHLLLGLIHGEDSGALRLLDRLGVAASQVRDAVSAKAASGEERPLAENSQLSRDSKKIVDGAHAETEQSGDERVGTEHLLMALLRSDGNPASEALRALGLSYERASRALGNVQMERGGTTGRVSLPNQEVKPGFLKGRDLLSVTDLAASEIQGLFELTREIKSGRCPESGRGKSLAMIFEKPSLRTRVTFSVAMTRLGGQSIYLSPGDIGLGTRETVPDVARCLGRWVDGIAARAFSHQTVLGLADSADIPVINALTDREHPCQALADFYTVLEKKSETKGMKFVFIGDGNNVARSLMLLAPLMRTHFVLACPPGYEPEREVLERARALSAEHGTHLEVTDDALEAADAADILYTDVWTSMGQEGDSEKRARDFAPFQVNADLIREAKDDVMVMHCLPAHRGQEITGEVLDGPLAGVFDQAENRLHVQMALLAAVL